MAKRKPTTKLMIGLSHETVSLVFYRDQPAVEILGCELVERRRFSELFLKQYVSDSGLKQSETRIVLSPSLYRWLSVDAPSKVPDEELAKAAKWLAKDLVNEPLDRLVVDAFLMPARQGKKPKLSVIVADQTLLSDLYRWCETAQLNLTEITVSELGLKNTISKSALPRGILYFDAHSFYIMVVQEGLIVLRRQFPVKDDEPASEKLFDKTALEVHRSFDYFETVFGEPVDRVYTVPSPFFSDALLAFLREQLRARIEAVDFAEIQASLGDDRWCDHVMVFGFLEAKGMNEEGGSLETAD